ncbi:MAG: amino acid/amide transporter substrate-binding protein family, partial [Rubritepida sp.]|nr:amino acid/amide transporter substrate-binding protein family [Rubritepida sp.]
EEEMHRNHHLSKPVMIGEIQADGQFNVVFKTPTAIPAENWSPFIPENANRRR